MCQHSVFVVGQLCYRKLFFDIHAIYTGLVAVVTDEEKEEELNFISI